MIRNVLAKHLEAYQQKVSEELVSLALNQVARWVTQQATVSVQLEQTDRLYAYIGQWLLNNSTKAPTHVEGIGSLRMESSLKFLDDDDDEPARSKKDVIIGNPGEGLYLIWRGKVPILLNYVTKFRRTNDQFSSPLTRHLTIWSYRGQLQVIIDFLQELNENSQVNEDRAVTVNVSSSHGYWERLHSVNRRPIESVVLPEGQVQHLIDDIESFFEGEEWYFQNAVPFRRGYLLHGLPGTGKSSLILAIASYFKMPLFILNLADPDLDDTKLQELFSSVGNNVMVLLEDVDTLWKDRDDGKDRKLSYSALLNALDGVTASQDRLLFMTTNRIDVLDPALIRPGRVDLRMEFGLLTAEQAKTMILRFYPELATTIDEIVEHPKITQMVAAELQKLLIDVRNEPLKFLQALDEYEVVKHEIQ